MEKSLKMQYNEEEKKTVALVDIEIRPRPVITIRYANSCDYLVSGVDILKSFVYYIKFFIKFGYNRLL